MPNAVPPQHVSPQTSAVVGQVPSKRPHNNHQQSPAMKHAHQNSPPRKTKHTPIVYNNSNRTHVMSRKPVQFRRSDNIKPWVNYHQHTNWKYTNQKHSTSSPSRTHTDISTKNNTNNTLEIYESALNQPNNHSSTVAHPVNDVSLKAKNHPSPIIPVPLDYKSDTKKTQISFATAQNISPDTLTPITVSVSNTVCPIQPNIVCTTLSVTVSEVATQTLTRSRSIHTQTDAPAITKITCCVGTSTDNLNIHSPQISVLAHGKSVSPCYVTVDNDNNRKISIIPPNDFSPPPSSSATKSKTVDESFVIDSQPYIHSDDELNTSDYLSLPPKLNTIVSTLTPDSVIIGLKENSHSVYKLNPFDATNIPRDSFLS